MNNSKGRPGYCAVVVLVSLVCGSHSVSAGHTSYDRVSAKHKGPWHHDLVIKRSNTSRFGRGGQLIVEGAHVPSLVESGAKVFAYFQWFPRDSQSQAWFDHIGMATAPIATDDWTKPTGVEFVGVPDTILGHRTRPMDPVAVSLPDGGIRLYFTLEPMRSRDPGDARIHSAVSHDGRRFVYEPGSRFRIDGTDVRDAAIAYFNGQWHMYCPDQKHRGTGYHALSDDGLTFVRQKDVRVREKGDWLGHTAVVGEKLYFFGTVWQGSSMDGNKWQSGRSLGTGPDPAVIRLSNGTWLAGTTPKRNQ
tara:strand:- start:9214 stop:10125 length:912 start_codon:yes stop_codon:yes gene_type:complete